MNNVIGYIIFVSYNRNEYDLKEIEVDDMSLEEFVEFDKNDEVDCKTISITPIYDFTGIKCGGSEKFDDSVYWYITKHIADGYNNISEFIQKYS